MLRRRMPFSAHLLLLDLCALVALLTATPTYATWSRDFAPMGLDGSPSGQGFCMATYNEQLVVGGYFDTAGGMATENIAIWNGDSWEGLDGGVNAEPEFLLSWGDNLYVGGPFTTAGGEAMARMARWDGSQWYGMPGLYDYPTSGAVHFGGLYVGGSFPTGDTYFPYQPIMRWSEGGATWEMVNPAQPWQSNYDTNAIVHFWDNLHIGGHIWTDGVDYPDTTFNHMAWSEENGTVGFGRGIEGGTVDCLAADADVLWIGGAFTHVDGVESRGLAYLNTGGSYNAVNDGDTPRIIMDMVIHDESPYVVERTGTYPYEYRVRRYANGTWSAPLGGQFNEMVMCIGRRNAHELYVGGLIDGGLARWDNDEWVHVGGGLAGSSSYYLTSLVPYQDGFVAGGSFNLNTFMEDEISCSGVAYWDGDAWHRLGNGPSGSYVQDLAIYEDDLYAATKFGDSVYAWNGTSWDPVDGGGSGQALCMAVHDGELVVGGFLTEVGGVTVERIAAWNGTSWRALGSFDGGVRALYVNQGVLYAGGDFTTVDGTTVNGIASWDGADWQSVGDGFDDGVYALTFHGGELIAGGQFTMSGATAVSHIARFDGAAWQPMGAGVAGADLVLGVSALRGTATHLYAGGDFDTAGGMPAAGIAYWDGAAWQELGDGLHEDGSRVTIFDLMVMDGDLVVAGLFEEAGNGIPSGNIAIWEDGTLVPAFLQTFRVQEVATGGAAGGMAGSPVVEAMWSLSGGTDPQDLQLTARTEQTGWDVEFAAVGAGPGGEIFLARDASPALAVADRVTYELQYRDGEDGWQVLAQQSVALSPPRAVRLHEAVPNPFNPATTIAFDLDREQDIRLEVYDLAGRRVAVLAEESLPSGRHAREWNGCDESGRGLASGPYLVRLTAEDVVRSQKVLLVR